MPFKHLRVLFFALSYEQSNIYLYLNVNSMDLSIDRKTFEEIAEAIHSDVSPVGIDAKKTHVLILEKLLQIEQRLTEIEKKLKD